MNDGTVDAKHSRRKFILLLPISGRSLSTDPAVSEAFVPLSPGEMFEELFVTDDTQFGNELFSLISLERDNVILEASAKDIKEIGSFAYHLLLSVTQPSTNRRLELLAKERLSDVVGFELDTPVIVRFRNAPYPAIVRYQGVLHGRGKGIWFGVELTDHQNHGDSDGSVGGRPYFRCGKNCGVFVSIADVYPRDTAHQGISHPQSEPWLDSSVASGRNSKDSRPMEKDTRGSSQLSTKGIGSTVQHLASSSLNMFNSFVDTIGNVGKEGHKPRPGFESRTFVPSKSPFNGCDQSHQSTKNLVGSGAIADSLSSASPIQLSDRVRCFLVHDYYIGTVKWLGRLPEERERMGGIDFDLAVGNGTGSHRGDQLFVTQPNHAAFVPITAMLKLEEDAGGSGLRKQGPITVQGQQMLSKKPSYSDIAKVPLKAAVAASDDSATPLPAAFLSSLPNSRLAASFPVSVKYSSSMFLPEPYQPAQVSRRSLHPSRISVEETVTKERRGRPSMALYDSSKNQKSHLEVEQQLIEDSKNCGISNQRPGKDAFDGRRLRKGALARLNDSERMGTSLAEKERVIPILPQKVEDDIMPLLEETSSLSVPPHMDAPYNCDSVFRMSENPGLEQYGLSNERRPSPNSHRQLVVSSNHRVLSPVGLRHINQGTEFGKKRGIQGHKNSCYLDATLFSMFAFTNVFDELLTRPRRQSDIHGYEEVQTILKDCIASPLRNTMFVQCDDVMKLRELMDAYGQITGLTNEERDPEEFLTSLFQQVMKMDPLLKLTSGDVNWYTLFVEKDQMNLIPTVQQLFDESLVASDVRLREAPKCLILQTPRSGAQYKMYRYVLPNAELDITDAISGYPRLCSICQEQADQECKECYNWMKFEDETRSRLGTMAFCIKCSKRRHKTLAKHRPYEIKTTSSAPADVRIIMELFAVICIKTSHYVTFAKEGSGLWYFVDSMADREGEGDTGFNIPEVTPCPEISELLEPETGHKVLMKKLEDNQSMPEPMSRFFEDCYFCMYQPRGVPNRDMFPHVINTVANL